MGKKKRSAKDPAERSLLGFNDVFADLANVAIFGGRRCVRPEDLRDYPVDSFYMTKGEFHGSGEIRRNYGRPTISRRR